MGSSASTLYHTDPRAVARQEFDYIIVGSGPAGCVLANRLSSDPNIRVLLVEAGGNNETELFSRIPAGWPSMMRTPSDWQFNTTPQKELADRNLYWPRGKILGGSTSINAMMYQHAPPEDIDEWERLGATGVNAKSMAPYFRRSEKFTPSARHTRTTHENRGDAGPWNTGYTIAHPISDQFVEAASRSGIHAVPDFNTPKGANGVSHMISFIDPKGERSSAATAFLPTSVRQRPNLTILLRTLCTRVVLSASSDSGSGEFVCTGAEFATEANGPRTRISARREVILCSGSIGTPQILMCSGIGPKNVMKESGVPIQLVNEHVGKNLADHLTAPSVFRAKESHDWLTSPVKSFPALVQWMLTGTGAMTTNAGDVVAFIRLDQTKKLWDTKQNHLPEPVPDSTSGPGAPDIEIIGAPLAFSKHGTALPPPGSLSFTMVPILLRPLSRGYISIKSGNVFDHPIIEANYFENKADIQNIIRSVRVSLTIAHTPPLADKLVFDYSKKNDDMNHLYWLADQDPETLTDERLEAWLRNHVQSAYHPVGTARIAKSATEGVVDSELRVFGVKGLRVADASVFPNQIAAHPTAMIIALGERLSDIILRGNPVV